MLTAEILQCLHKEKKPWRIFDYVWQFPFSEIIARALVSVLLLAVNGLGLALAELDEVKSQIAHGETVSRNSKYDIFLNGSNWYP